MIAKNFTAVSSQDIQALVTNSACESTTLEFKRDLPGGGDEAKREFLADVSALANTSGGDLLFGIEEEGGCAAAITGIGTTDTDAELLRLGSVLSAGLDPRIRYSGKAVPCDEGIVLMLRVEKSWNAPHRVVFKASDRFYGRSVTGKYPLDVQQLRRAFVENATVAERMKNFRIDRLASIIGGATPLPMATTPKFVLHLLPFESFFSDLRHDLREDLPLNVSLPLGGPAWDSRLTFEGRMTIAFPREGEPCSSYLHFYRTGVIEMVDSALLSHRLPNSPDQQYIPGVGFERLIVTGVERGLQLLRHIGASAPVAIAVTLTDVKGMTIGVDNWRYNVVQRPVLNDHLFLPESIISELDDPVHPLIQPLADMVWNACGVLRSPHFDADGNWTPPRR